MYTELRGELAEITSTVRLVFLSTSPPIGWREWGGLPSSEHGDKSMRAALFCLADGPFGLNRSSRCSFPVKKMSCLGEFREHSKQQPFP